MNGAARRNRAARLLQPAQHRAVSWLFESQSRQPGSPAGDDPPGVAGFVRAVFSWRADRALRRGLPAAPALEQARVVTVGRDFEGYGRQV